MTFELLQLIECHTAAPAWTSRVQGSSDEITADWLAELRRSGVTALMVETFELANAVAEAAK